MRGVTDSIITNKDEETFLLTRLMRGVTIKSLVTDNERVHFYSHASCEA